MTTGKFTVPNWAQELIAVAAGLDPQGVAVRHEDDRHITFLQYMPRKEITVSKATGNKSITQDEYADQRVAGRPVGRALVDPVLAMITGGTDGS